ncbi:MAG: hypothetical protein NTV68_13575 [Methanomicrobiales archaeon]|nr:hypothetical protein [Methanomicrobiales archaeon]
MKRFSLCLEETDRYTAATPLIEMRIGIQGIIFLAFLVDVIVNLLRLSPRTNQ